jgi:hypothetical protein
MEHRPNHDAFLQDLRRLHDHPRGRSCGSYYPQLALRQRQNEGSGRSLPRFLVQTPGNLPRALAQVRCSS